METILVAGVPTEIYSRYSAHGSDCKAFIIPGNPGVIDFYFLFADCLFNNFDGKIDVIVVGHAGHGRESPGVFSVQEQIEHKITFLENVVSDSKGKKQRFVLIGHSVGSYISLKIIQNAPHLPVSHVVNLFPTFRHLWKGLASPVKIAVQPYIRQTLSLVVGAIPTVAKALVVQRVLGWDRTAAVSLAKKATSLTLQNILFMAWTEAQDIIEPDAEFLRLLSENCKRMLFIYGTTDQYTPALYYEDMRALSPHDNVEYADEGVKHAFVILHSELIASKVAKFLSPHIL